ncbi:hypothetical protein ABMY26_01775 [Azospirillum sp. HJ39]|uniref:hypothetical protein n=1 Tax=Azospirillum sp. HJ39 TaxID=3159496 RepID=UPI003555DF74
MLRSDPQGTGPAPPGEMVLDYQLARILLPVKLKQLVVEGSADAAYAIEISPPRVSGDPSAMYTFHYDASVFSDDIVTVKTNANTRLLQSIDLQTDSKADEIIVKVAQSISLLESGAAGTAAIDRIDVEIDPVDHDAVGHLKESLITASGGAVTEFDITPVGAPPPKSTAPDCSVGFCYRVPVPYKVSYRFKDGGQYVHEISIPNRGPIVAVPLSRAAFVKKISKVTFVDGTPSEISVTKPSEALEVISLPITIAKGIISILTEVFQLKIDQSKKATELAEQLVKEKEAKEKTKNEGGDPPASRVFMFGSTANWVRAGIPRTQTPVPDSGNPPLDGFESEH